ncbi:class I SAM-dependent methyltransferase [Psychromonas antarctica]|uniref:class I SAM-dependent methyltransferase n=1 Tax=Psychromonas antarctica TaxID=67573 RepID=UPI001EE7FD1A|nr:class I SAM-dependent methyltransferase [Psychromonas antarctica]MCG6200804.1 class I SAM-dependent methyltransferase [Psychromonas antarctica]
MDIPLICNERILRHKAQQLREKWGFLSTTSEHFQLLLLPEYLALEQKDDPQQGLVFVDFASGAVAHRRKFGGGKGQAIAKAVGLKAGVQIDVIDATAGLGRDAFVLASLGCKVTLVERSPVAAALLEDGLQRAYLDYEIGEWMQQRMQLHFGSAYDYLQSHETDVVYLDPMFPHKKKSALVKKEMRVFQGVVGADLDADCLLEAALNAARYRVVVKRPDYAPFLNDRKPSMSIETKKNRFDVYVKQAIPQNKS